MSQYFTEEGLKKMKDELHQLIAVERPKISAQIAEARDKGDLSENAEYDAAKEAQGLMELKISQMQEIVRNAKIIDESKLDNSKILILSKVTLKNTLNNSTLTYSIVPANEADIKVGKISVESPIGKGLLGKKIGEVAEIKVPSGAVMHFEIMDIQRS
jgi:transcription elongation factor GreA